MEVVTMQDYLNAKGEFLEDSSCKKRSFTDKDGRLHRTFYCENGEVFGEVRYDGGIEFWTSINPGVKKVIRPIFRPARKMDREYIAANKARVDKYYGEDAPAIFALI